MAELSRTTLNPFRQYLFNTLVQEYLETLRKLPWR